MSYCRDGREVVWEKERLHTPLPQSQTARRRREKRWAIPLFSAAGPRIRSWFARRSNRDESRFHRHGENLVEFSCPLENQGEKTIWAKYQGENRKTKFTMLAVYASRNIALAKLPKKGERKNIAIFFSVLCQPRSYKNKEKGTDVFVSFSCYSRKFIFKHWYKFIKYKAICVYKLWNVIYSIGIEQLNNWYWYWIIRTLKKRKKIYIK